MSTQAGRRRGESLGAWLDGLRPGDACPWCGARLQVAGGSGPVVGHAVTRADLEAGRAALVCTACGCEVAAGDESEEAWWRVFRHAA
jgi:hypothetical protein